MSGYFWGLDIMLFSEDDRGFLLFSLDSGSYDLECRLGTPRTEKY